MTKAKKKKDKRAISSKKNGKKGGRPPIKENVEIRALKEEIRQFGAEMIDVTDPKTGKIIKLKRVLMTMDKMFKLFINHDNVSAGKIFLEYTIGAPDQNLDVLSAGEKLTINFGVEKSAFIKPEDDK